MFPRAVRFADIDSLGHVNNVRFLDYLEDARLAMFHIDPHREGEAAFRRPCDRPARDRLPAAAHLPPRPGPGGDLGDRDPAGEVHPRYEIRDDEEIFVQARSVLVAYDVERAAPRRLNQDELAYLRRFAAVPGWPAGSFRCSVRRQPRTPPPVDRRAGRTPRGQGVCSQAAVSGRSRWPSIGSAADQDAFVRRKPYGLGAAVECADQRAAGEEQRVLGRVQPLQPYGTVRTSVAAAGQGAPVELQRRVRVTRLPSRR